MATLRSKANCDLSVTALNGRVVAPDELVEVDDETYQSVVWPEETWTVVDAPEDPRTVVELRAELERRGLTTTGRKAELIRRLEDAGPEDSPGTSVGRVTPGNEE